MSTVPARRSRRQRLNLDNVDWRTYSRLLRVFAERPGYRLTYDRGRLEIMSPLPEHELAGSLLARFVDVLVEEMNLPAQCGGSTTLRRRSLRRGLEPDRCYWIASANLVRGKMRLDFAVDPPPDLAIEVDVISSSLDRMSIYASLGVPEVWRLEQGALSFHALGAGRRYAPVSNSLSFPSVTPADLSRFLALLATELHTTIVGQFRAWMRQQLAGGGAPPAP
jgi:Uma2 family endonuclease